MSLREEIKGFVDGNNLVAPLKGPYPSKAASFNGIRYTSEYFVILAKSHDISSNDQVDYLVKVLSCLTKDYMLTRIPPYLNNGDQGGQQAVDDYYALMNGCIHTNESTVPRGILKALVKHLGFLNNLNPWQLNAKAFMLRQPQLIASMISAAFPRKILHFPIRLLALPLYIYAAIIIATACMLSKPEDTDARVLSWHLLQTTSRCSLSCYLASKLWNKRLEKHYGKGLMRSVAAIAYEPHGEHPFAKYWVS